MFAVNEHDRDDLEQQYAAILRFLRRSGASPEDAEDIAQTVFAEATANAERLQSDERPAIAWLYTVARRRAIDHLRRENRRKRLEKELPVPLGRDEHYGAHVTHALKAALDTLPHEQREVVVRRLLGAASFREIADQLGTTEAACKMRFVRGLATIRAALENEGLNP